MTSDPQMDPAIAACVTQSLKRGAKRRDLSNIPGSREQMRREQSWWTENLPPIHEVRDEVLDLGPKKLPIRLYRAGADIRGPVILYLHGGGWCIGDRDTHENVARGLAIASKFVVVSLDYSLAPEAQFPIAYDETLLAAKALRGAEGQRLNVDASRLALAGDSAGANLALAGALGLREAGTPAQGLGLFYGAYDTALETTSYHQFGDGRYGLSRGEMQQFYAYYAPKAAPKDWRLAPLHADLAGAPPAYMISCGLDVLRDDSIAMAAAFAKAGVRYRLDSAPGATHGFLRFGDAAPIAAHHIGEAARFLREVMG